MKLTLKLGAAIGIAALSACSQTGQDNSAAMENSSAATEETVLPPDEGGGPTDTLGNQLDQLNETDAGGGTGTSNETNSL